jgi:hypothetical protein
MIGGWEIVRLVAVAMVLCAGLCGALLIVGVVMRAREKRNRAVPPRLGVLVGLGLLSFAAIAHARLGESNVEIAKRYGPVQSRTENGTNKWTGAYLFKDYLVMVTFETNTCVTEVVGPAEQRKFTRAEAEALRDAIGGAGNWKVMPNAKFTRTQWINSSNKVVAILDEPFGGSPTLVVSRLASMLEAGKESQKKEASKTDGF